MVALCRPPLNEIQLGLVLTEGFPEGPANPGQVLLQFAVHIENDIPDGLVLFDWRSILAATRYNRYRTVKWWSSRRSTSNA